MSHSLFCEQTLSNSLAERCRLLTIQNLKFILLQRSSGLRQPRPRFGKHSPDGRSKALAAKQLRGLSSNLNQYKFPTRSHSDTTTRSKLAGRQIPHQANCLTMRSTVFQDRPTVQSGRGTNISAANPALE